MLLICKVQMGCHIEGSKRTEIALATAQEFKQLENLHPVPKYEA